MVGLVLSGLLAVFGALLLLGGLALIGVDAFARDDDGYFSTADEALHSDAYAITTEDIDLGGGWAPNDVLGTVRISVEAADEQPVFLGIGASADVDDYLGASVAPS